MFAAKRVAATNLLYFATMEDTKLNVPAHVGIIMDGNGRWAKRRLLPRSAGHAAGMDRMIGLIKKAQAMGVKYLTVYALSTENLNRPKEELDKLFDLVRKYFIVNLKKLLKEGAAVKVIGDLTLLPPDIQKTIEDGLSASPKESDKFTFIMALGYGSRPEIVTAVNRAVEAGKKVTEEEFSSMLYTGGIPDPDFIIRTGGEVRLSNFLLWQAAYAELYFTDTLFPDFTDHRFEKAIESYSGRVRRFGKV